LIRLVEIGGRADEPLVDALHRGIYLDEFADQVEPVEAWKHALWSGESPYAMTIRVALDSLSDEIVAGIAFEHYPRSGCGLVTYMVVAPSGRQRGVGRRLLGDAVAALHARGGPVVFGEVNDPRLRDGNKREPADVAWARLERNQRWGARVVDVRYVQPALGDGLARDRGLCLIALAGAAPLPDALDGAMVRAFVAELHEVTERRAPDDEVRAMLDAIPARTALVTLARTAA
jgi:GNAT superfamily N-acetyltransferase